MKRLIAILVILAAIISVTGCDTFDDVTYYAVLREETEFGHPSVADIGGVGVCEIPSLAEGETMPELKNGDLIEIVFEKDAPIMECYPGRFAGYAKSIKVCYEGVTVVRGSSVTAYVFDLPESIADAKVGDAVCYGDCNAEIIDVFEGRATVGISINEGDFLKALAKGTLTLAKM